MTLSQIAAVSENLALGKDNKLLWHYPEDLKHFKATTLGKIMIMGRKTFDSFGGKPLPKRIHIVISHQTRPNSENVFYATSITAALQLAKQLIQEKSLPEEVMIIGGGQIYKESLPLCDTLYLTFVHGQYEADTFYPESYKQLFCQTRSQFIENNENLRLEIWKRIK